MEADFSFKSLDVGEGSQINQFDLPSLPSRDEAIKFLGNNKILAVGLAFAAVVVTVGIAFAFAAQTALSIALSPIALVIGLVALPIILSDGERCREVERSESELTESLDNESKLSGTQPHEGLYLENVQHEKDWGTSNDDIHSILAEAERLSPGNHADDSEFEDIEL